jgi:hypothetical protein
VRDEPHRWSGRGISGRTKSAVLKAGFVFVHTDGVPHLTTSGHDLLEKHEAEENAG